MYLMYVRVFIRKLHYGLATHVAEPFGDVRGHTMYATTYVAANFSGKLYFYVKNAAAA